MARDNFTKAVIEKLRTRVAHRCSNPECRVPTIGPATDPDKTTSIGIAAHITAASAGGPRYAIALTEKARKSMENGIWLCSNCSIAIDKDVDRYSIELLKQWKLEAEQLAKQELGKRLPHKNDAIDTLTTALTGKPQRFLPEAISNIHQASSTALEALDPRFSVKSNYVDGTAHFGLFAKQDVQLSMKINREYAQEYVDKYRKLIDHGVDLDITGDAISFNGSKLLEEISANLAGGTIKFSPRKKNATQKIWLVNKETSFVENFDDIVGTISIGSKSFSFSGTACNGVFSFNYQKGINPKKTSATINTTVNFAKWTNLDVRVLPYFNKLHSLFEKISKGWSFFTCLEIDGMEMLKSKELSMNKFDFINDIYRTLSIIETVRILATALNIKIAFDPNFYFTAQEYAELLNAVDIIQGKHVYSKDEINGSISSKFVIDKTENNIGLLQQHNQPMNLDFVQSNGDVLQVFSQEILLPKKIIHLRAVTPKLISALGANEQADGDSINVEWIPSDDFEYKVEFEKTVLGI